MKKQITTLGVDIGGSKILMIAWDGRQILKSRQFREVSLAKLKEGIDYFKPDRIGLAVPGILEPRSSVILKCPNLPFFEGLNFKKIFKHKVLADNDVNCFLLAEKKIGLLKKCRNALALTFGTGIGGAVLINGKIYKGSHGSAGEFGHMVIDKGQTWERLYQANKNNLQEQKRLNSLALANLINFFNPELIVLGGKGAQAPYFSLLKKNIISPLALEAKILLSQLGPEAVALGAAFLFEDD